MLRLFRMVWKLFILASVFGIGYIIGREHSFEEDEDWENDENETPEKSDENESPAGKKSVSFEYQDPKAVSVSVVGDFNDWNKDKNAMTLDNGVWKCSIPLKDGNHEYKFVVNNTDWVTDPKAGETVADKYGGRSSIIQVK